MSRCLNVVIAVAGLSTCGFAEKPLASVGIVDEKPSSGIFVEVDGKFMVPYTAKIPGTDISFEMVPVPAGEYMMGSPDDEENRKGSEGPQVKVKVAPMWVGMHEVTWKEYDHFMLLYHAFTDFEIDGNRKLTDENTADSVTAPTPLYEPPHTFEYGHDPEQPAVTMTQYSAQQYTKWLSVISGLQYRLPSEAEWEYACRAGSTTAYNWGDDPDDVDDHAWYFDNAPDGQEYVGKKKPNAFGLHDMHGNVGEITVNSFTEDGYQSLAKKQPINAVENVAWPTETADAIVVRGGTWESDIEQLRSAARLSSDDDEWKSNDPQIPTSPWWFSADPARGVGFRLFRSYGQLDESLIRKYWDNIAEDANDVVEGRIAGGNGKRGVVDSKLPEAINDLGLTQ